MSYNFHAFETIQSKVLNTTLCPIRPGQYLICTDSGNVYYDTADYVRKPLTDIVDIETEAARTAILTPIDKIYFVKETAHFWRYLNGRWVDLSTASIQSDVKTYTKEFIASDWHNGTIAIPASEHGQALSNNTVLSKIYVLVGGAYSDQCLAAMDTTVLVSDDKSILLSYGGAGYAGKIILIG